jgi:HrpA-like RNA helicase
LKITLGSDEANVIRAAVKEYKYQFPEEVAKWVFGRQPLGQLDPNITISGTTTRKILRNKSYVAADSTNVKPIVRKRELRKNLLTEKHLLLRKSYCDLVDKWYKADALIITADEYQEHFGGSGLRRVNTDKGTNLYRSKAPIRFSREQWAASSDDPTIIRPHCIWEAEKATNYKDWHRQLREAKKVLDEEVRRRRARCDKEGTIEHYLLQQKNKEVDRENEKRFHRRSQGDRYGSLKYWTPTRLFPFDKIEKEEEKGDLDFLFMAFEIYRKYLFPYARDLAMFNPHRQVIILEDNDGSHHKARRLLAPKILNLRNSIESLLGHIHLFPLSLP